MFSVILQLILLLYQQHLTDHKLGGSEYTTGVTRDTSANTLTYVVPTGAPTLYYYCTSHSGMGGQANTPAPVNNNLKLTTTNQGSDNITNTQYAAFDDVLFSEADLRFHFQTAHNRNHIIGGISIWLQSTSANFPLHIKDITMPQLRMLRKMYLNNGSAYIAKTSQQVIFQRKIKSLELICIKRCSNNSRWTFFITMDLLLLDLVQEQLHYLKTQGTG